MKKVFIYIKTSNGTLFRAIEKEQIMTINRLSEPITIDKGEVLIGNNCWQSVTDFVFTFDSETTMWRQEEK